MEASLWFRKGQVDGSSEQCNVYRDFFVEPVVSWGEDMSSIQKVLSE